MNLLAKAYLTWKDKKYLQAARHCAESGSGAYSARGLAFVMELQVRSESVKLESDNYKEPSSYMEYC